MQRGADRNVVRIAELVAVGGEDFMPALGIAQFTTCDVGQGFALYNADLAATRLKACGARGWRTGPGGNLTGETVQRMRSVGPPI